MAADVAHLSRACFFQLRFLSAFYVVQAFESCHLDYCNRLLYKILDTLTAKLQRIQNVAVLVTGTRRADHITPAILQRLRWLPVFYMYLSWAPAYIHGITVCSELVGNIYVSLVATNLRCKEASSCSSCCLSVRSFIITQLFSIIMLWSWTTCCRFSCFFHSRLKTFVYSKSFPP